MTLVDTSVWIDMFHGSDRAAGLAALLEAGEVLVHPWVRGELALGKLGRRRAAILDDLDKLPAAPVVGHDEVLRMIDVHSLDGTGIGWVDAHLLASALVARVGLWTLDRRLAQVAAGLALSQGR